jgi:hypothetical protein
VRKRRRRLAILAPLANQLIEPWTRFNGRPAIRAGNWKSIGIGNMLCLLDSGWVLVHCEARQTPRVGSRGGRNIKSIRHRYIHAATGRLHPVRPPAYPLRVATWCQDRGFVVQESDGRWSITDRGRLAAASFRQAGCHSPTILRHAPDGYRINGVDYPHPYLQPECPRAAGTKGLWSKGWLAAWQDLPRVNPDKRSRRAWLDGYDLAMRRKFGQ